MAVLILDGTPFLAEKKRAMSLGLIEEAPAALIVSSLKPDARKSAK